LGESESLEQGGVGLPGQTTRAPSRATAPSRWHLILVWVAFLFAFSPLLSDLVEHARAHPWAAWNLLFAVPLALLARRDSSPESPRRDGYAWLGMALALEGLAIAGGPLRWGRPAIPLGVLGLARILGRPSLRVAALACWALPLPTFIASVASPLLEYIWLRSAAALLSLFAPISVHQAYASWPQGVLQLQPADGGLPLALFLSGVGWIYALPIWRGFLRALMTAAWWGLVGLPVQGLVVLIALALAVGDRAEVARLWLSWGAFLGCALLAVAAMARTLRLSPDRAL